MERILEAIKQFHKDDEGGVVEQGILYALGAIAAVGAMLFLLPRIRNVFNRTGQELDQTSNSSY